MLGWKKKHESALTGYEQKIKTLELIIENATDFVREIEKGNLATPYKEVASTEDDLLSDSLMSMQSKMLKIRAEEKQRKWINEGLTKFGDIIRNNNESLKSLSREIVSALCRHLGAHQCGIFILDESSYEEKYLELIACYAYDRQKFQKRKIKVQEEFAEGLVGQTFIEGQKVIIKQVPENYPYIQSGLGESQPSSILIIPLKANDTSYGVLELASFQEFTPHQIEFLDQFSENIAASIASVKINERTKKLLHSSQQQGEQLRTQEEEMRQNMEELQATQEAMRRKQEEISKTNRKLIANEEKLQEALKEAQLQADELQQNEAQLKENLDKLHALQDEMRLNQSQLERLSLVADNTDNSVIISNKNGQIEYINQGFEKMSGFTLEEVKGKEPDTLLVGPDTDIETVTRIKKSVQLNRPINEEILHYDKQGKSYWVSMTINPIFDEQGLISQFITIQTNITETKKTSLDLNSKLIALSNSFGIVEFDLDGFIINCNEVFSDWLGFSQKEILSFSHHELIHLDNAQDNPRLLWEKIKKNESYQGEFQFERRAKDTIWLKGAYNLVFGIDKKPYKMILVTSNIHQQKILMEENRLAQIEIKAQKEELIRNLEELKNSHKTLEQNQKQAQEIASQLSQILEGCVDSVITIDQSGIIQLFNQAAEDLWGYSRDEVIGKNVKMLMPNARSREHDQYLKNYQNTGQAKVIGSGREVEALRKDGSRVPILLTLSEAKLTNGSIYTAFIKDITEKKRLEEQDRQQTAALQASQEELRQNLEELQSTHEAVDRKQKQVEELALKFEQILEGCVDSVITIDQSGIIQLFNQAAEDLWGYSRDEIIGKNVKMLMPGARSREHDQYLKNYQNTGQAQVIGSGREVEALRKDGSRVPILLTLSEAKLTNGSIYTAFIKDITEKKRLEEQASQFTEALQASQEELRQNLEELESTNESMLKKQAQIQEMAYRFEQTLEGCVDSVITIDQKGVIQFFNQAAEKLWGYSRQDVMGKNVKVLMPPRESQEHDQYLSNYHQTRQAKVIGIGREVEALRKDGNRVPILLTLSEVKLEEGPIYTAFIKDISEKKKLEKQAREFTQALQTSEEELRQNLEELESINEEMGKKQAQIQEMAYRFEQTLEGCVDSVITINQKGVIQFFNQSAEKLWGYSRQEVIGKNVRILMPPQESREHDQYLSNYHQTRQAKVIGIGREVEALRKDGILVPILLTLSEVKFEDGSIYTAFIKDITEKKRLEQIAQQQTEELRISKEQLNQNLEELKSTQEVLNQHAIKMRAQVRIIDSALATIDFDPEGNILKANNLFLDRMGYTLEEIQGKHHRIFMPSEERDSPDYQKFWQNLKLGIARSGVVCRLDKSGNEIWLSASYTPLMDSEGKLLKVRKFAHDITEQKLQSIDHQSQIKAIQRSNLVVEFDTQGHIRYANEAFLLATGYEWEEIKEKHHTMFVREQEKNTAEYQQFWQRLQEGEVFRATFERIKKSGESIWIQGTYNPIFDLKGRVYKIIKYAQDISKQKKLELENQSTQEKLMAQEEKLRQYFRELEATQVQLSHKSLEMEGQLAALNRTLCSIEFDMGGHIIAINDNFLHTMGFQKEDLLGKHHRVFLKPPEANSEAYQVFWEKLREGIPQVGSFLRYTREGKPVWFNATYTPVNDHQGKPYKVIKLANDISVEKERSREAELKLQAMMEATAVAEFDLEGNILSANAQFLNLHGYNWEEIQNQTLHLLPGNQDSSKKKTEELLAAMEASNSLSQEFLSRHKDGSERRIKGHFHPVTNLKGEVYKIISHAFLLSERDLGLN